MSDEQGASLGSCQDRGFLVAPEGHFFPSA